MNNQIKQERAMRWILFWIFVVLFVLVVLGTLGAVFLGFGQLQGRERDTLFNVFLIEIGVAVVALFYSIFGLKKKAASKSTEQEDLNLIPSKYDEIFNVEQSLDFYNRIANDYDERNTNFLLQTHRQVIRTIDEFVSNKESAKILDLGGGTGRLIATQFFNKNNLKWVYLDNSSSMVEQFRKNMKDANLEIQIVFKSIFDISKELFNEVYDVIILSLVLTSLSRYPDFEALKLLLNQEGILIIADIDPVYTALEPYYSVPLSNDGILALKTNPLHPLDIIEKLSFYGFRVISSKSIKLHNGTRYSYMLVFSL